VSPAPEAVSQLRSRLHDAVPLAEELVRWTASLALPHSRQHAVLEALRIMDDYSAAGRGCRSPHRPRRRSAARTGGAPAKSSCAGRISCVTSFVHAPMEVKRVPAQVQSKALDHRV
jgi:hypothetical protein